MRDTHFAKHCQNEFLWAEVRINKILDGQGRWSGDRPDLEQGRPKHFLCRYRVPDM